MPQAAQTSSRPQDRPHLKVAGIENEEPETPNPQTPKYFPHPAQSPVVQAVVNAEQEYQRAWLKNVLDLWAWKMVEGLGECDYDGDPNEQARAALHIYIECAHARTVQKNSDPIVLAAEKSEWERFQHFSHIAKFGLDQ